MSAERLYEEMKRALGKIVPEFELRHKAELAYEINRLKQERNAVILGHNYMEAALFYSTNPNEFALKVSGIDGTSVRTFAEEVMEDGGVGGGDEMGIEGMTP